MTPARWTLLSVLLICAALTLAAALTPSLRVKIQNYLSNPGREILATAEGDLLNDGSRVKVIKYRDSSGIFLEVLKPDGDRFQLLDRMDLPDKHDGLFNLQGHVTRLAITDVNEDGSLELLAPSFDQQLVPHLNVFRYNSLTKRFELFTPNQK